MDNAPQTRPKDFRNVGLEIVELSHYDGALRPLLDALDAQVYPRDTVGTVLRIHPTLIVQGEGREAVNLAARKLIATLDAIITPLRGICAETSPNMPLTVADYVRHFMLFDAKLQPAGMFELPWFVTLTEKMPQDLSAERNAKLRQALMDALWILEKSKSAIDLKSMYCPGKSYLELMIKLRSTMTASYVPPSRSEGDRFSMMLAVARMVNSLPPKRVRLAPTNPRKRKVASPASVAAAAATPRHPPVNLGVVAQTVEEDEDYSEDIEDEEDEEEEDEIEDEETGSSHTFDDDVNDGTKTRKGGKKARVIEDEPDDEPVGHVVSREYREIVQVK